MEHHRIHSNSFRNVCAFHHQIEIWKCWFLNRGENRTSREKTSQSIVENQQQTQPTYADGSRKQGRDTLVGGEHSHHCDILQLPLEKKHDNPKTALDKNLKTIDDKMAELKERYQPSLR